MSHTMSPPPARTTPGAHRPARTTTPGGVGLGAAAALLIGTALGGLTDLAQTWLPWIASSLANSGGVWVLVSFLVALAAASAARAATQGGLSLLGLVIGYYLTAVQRGVAVSPTAVRFWLLAALVIGPVVGLAAAWVRYGTPWRVAVGAGVISGLLGGEGVYGLRFIAHSTSSVYWAAQILFGLGLMLGLLAWRARPPAVRPVAIVTAFTVGAGTVAAFMTPW
jgi:hypothetical protein